LARKAVLLTGAFQGMAQWFQLVAECILLACVALEGRSIAECTGHRKGVYAPAQVSGMGSSGSIWAGMPHLRLV